VKPLMSDQVFVEVSFDDGTLNFTPELMQAMWEPTRLVPYPVDGTFAFDYKGERFGVADLLCYMDQLTKELRDQGPEKIIEQVLELINSVYIGDEDFTLIGRCVDLYAVELDGRAAIVFRTLILDGRKEVEEMLLIREVVKSMFPVPNPE
jgi:hypothetical protein